MSEQNNAVAAEDPCRQKDDSLKEYLQFAVHKYLQIVLMHPRHRFSAPAARRARPRLVHQGAADATAFFGTSAMPELALDLARGQLFGPCPTPSIPRAVNLCGLAGLRVGNLIAACPTIQRGRWAALQNPQNVRLSLFDAGNQLRRNSACRFDSQPVGACHLDGHAKLG